MVMVAVFLTNEDTAVSTDTKKKKRKRKKQSSFLIYEAALWYPQLLRSGFSSRRHCGQRSLFEFRNRLLSGIRVPPPIAIAPWSDGVGDSRVR